MNLIRTELETNVDQSNILQTERYSPLQRLSGNVSSIRPSLLKDIDLKIFSKKVIEGNQSFETETDCQKVPSLLVQSIQSFSQHTQGDEVLEELLKLNYEIQQSPSHPLFSSLSAALFNQLKTISIKESPDLIMEFVLARVRSGEPCDKVAKEYGIPTAGSHMDKLQMAAVEGAAGKKAISEKDCIEVAAQHGIMLHSKAMKALLMMAVNGRAGERVSAGESCITVAHEHGIASSTICIHNDVYDALELKAVMGKAGARVNSGDPWELVLNEHGIRPNSDAANKLSNIANFKPLVSSLLKRKM